MTAQVVALREDLEPGETLKLELDDDSGDLVEVALARAESGEYFAIGDVCSHGQVSLSEGEVDGYTLECWLHGSVFDLRNGWPLVLPATRPVPTYPVTYAGEKLLVDVDSPTTASKPA